MSHADFNAYLYSEADRPQGRVRLDFRHHDALGTIDEPMRGDISGMAVSGDFMWAVSDETCSVERLKRRRDGSYGSHRTFDLGDFFDLPANTEIDLEGVTLDGDWLWLVGSHALKRKRPRPERDSAEKTVKRLGKVVREPNRYFLARVPLEEGATGPEPVTRADDGRTAAVVRMKKGGNDVEKALADDPWIGPSLAIPAKENGFDVEGVAARGNRVFLGLRGPVLRGMAVMVELAVKDDGEGRLKLQKGFRGGRKYRLHFIDLGGMGVRDMALDGDDRLLMLVGPTMDLDGPVAVVAMREPFGHMHDVTFADEIAPVLRVPHGPGTDHAEGLAPTRDGHLLIAYDSPDPSRLHDDRQGKDVDVFKPRERPSAGEPPAAIAENVTARQGRGASEP